jgi:pyruvate/2-oxoglutarate dehydrogenase complex dihydrolipoamide dehydrogenase (E3) component
LGETLTPDLCVIGAGSAGLSVAAIAASFGVPVVLIEKDRMGGDCLNVGCVPSKALIAAGNSRHDIRRAARFGIGRGRSEPSVSPARVRDHVTGVIAAIAPNDSEERYQAMGVRVIRAEARFADAETVEAGGIAIKARRFVLATGSRPAVPPISGLDQVAFHTNETIFDLAEKPLRLIVIGGGPIGVEIAQAHRRLGTDVAVVEALPRILSHEDPEMAAVVERSLLEDGIDLRTGAMIERVEPRAGGNLAVLVRRGDIVETVEASHLLLAVGREPVTTGLGLEAAGIAFDAGGITADAGLKTTNPKVYAIGDCAGGAAGGQRYTHVANHHAGLVIRNALFRRPVDVGRVPVPRVTFTDPELAAIGLSEEAARATGKPFRILRWPVAENDRAQAERRTRGHVKAIVTPRGRILGCAIAAPHAGELIAPWALAMTKGLKVQDLAAVVFPYPTFSEVTKRTAVEYLRPYAQSPWLRGAIGLLRRFG